MINIFLWWLNFDKFCCLLFEANLVFGSVYCQQTVHASNPRQCKEFSLLQRLVKTYGLTENWTISVILITQQTGVDMTGDDNLQNSNVILLSI